ncbi:MAG: restriction endonuclease subunit S [Peptococcaceae bacterium]|nr:restriction endonuclease subunit S [Peptococcaceae bacterium]
MRVKLGDIATLITKGTTPTTLGYNFVDEGINFVKIESITENGEFLVEKFAHITHECNENLSRSQLKKNDLLFSIAGAIGRTAIVTDEILPANTNQALAIIRVPEGIINYQYLNYLMQSPVITEQLEKRKQGVAQLNLSLKDISEFEITMYDDEKQNEIVACMNKVIDLISLRKQQLFILDELVKARFVELFGACDTYELLQDSNIYISDGNYSSKYPTADEFVEEGVPFIRASNMEMNTIVDNNMYFITKEKHAILLKGHVKAGDVLITTRGATIGKIACVPPRHEDSNINAQIVLLRCPKKEYNPLFLSWYLKLDNTQAEIQKLISGSAQPQLPIKRLVQLNLLKPDINLQNQFAVFVEQTDKSKLAVQKSLEQLETLKKALMQQYFG